jgi:hypothetical protein
MMLSQIQHGIQAGHAAVELMLKYNAPYIDATIPAEHGEMVEDWATNHKTFIVLNGGVSDSLYALRRLLAQPENPYPWVFFKEPNIANAVTSIAVLLPKEAYADEDWGSALERPDLDPVGAWKAHFQAIKARCPLA